MRLTQVKHVVAARMIAANERERTYSLSLQQVGDPKNKPCLENAIAGAGIREQDQRSRSQIG